MTDDCNRDHASLFVFSPPLARVLDENGTVLPITALNPDSMKLYRGHDRPQLPESLHRILATGIYKTRDSRFYHVHG